jgi:hypothetical protein
MSTTTHHHLRLAIVAGVAVFASVLATPAYAGPDVDAGAPSSRPAPTVQPMPECPTAMDAMRRDLRAAGFSSQAARDFAELTRLDCLAVVTAR